METKPEKQILETPKETSEESTETLTQEGIASIQGKDLSTSTEKLETSHLDTGTSTTELEPPPEYRPATTDGTEKAEAAKIETGVEKPEKEHYSYNENEIGKPGSLKYNPGHPEAGG